MTFNPIINFRPTTIRKAFLLNAFILACIAALSIELRHQLDKIQQTKGLAEYMKLLITMIGTFIISIIIYLISRILFGFGGGMLTSHKVKTLF